MIYDTSNGAIAAYEKALRDGADFVVGPLLKEAVADIMLQPEKVPTLVLNTHSVTSFRDEQIFQFALAPEDEARRTVEVEAFCSCSSLIAIGVREYSAALAMS